MNHHKKMRSFEIRSVEMRLKAPDCCSLAFSFAARADSVVNSVHNLTVNGPGTIKATSESDVCIFCHTVASRQWRDAVVEP